LSNKKHIALVTTWFPPQMGVATNRMLAFAQYLSETFEVTVFALAEKDEIVSTFFPDVTVQYTKATSWQTALEDKTEDGKWVHRMKVGTRLLLRQLLPEALSQWKKVTLKKLISVHEAKAFDLIISSYAPAECHEIALNFKNQFSQIPWIADMRDEMSTNPFFDTKTRKKLKKLELEMQSKVNAITTVSFPLVELFQKDFPSIQSVMEVRNGFNHDFQRDLKAQEDGQKLFTIGYFGTFYGSRKPHTFFAGMDLWLQFHPDNAVEFRIIGAHRNFEIPKSLTNKVLLFPPLKYAQAIEEMSKMQLNVLIHPVNGQKGVFTGKLFDYLSVQRPIFACVDPEDVAAQLITEAKAGYVASFDEPEIIALQLENAYQDWKNGQQRFASTEFVQSQQRREGVKKLVKGINLLLS
jgi:hypothetical protein